MSAEPQPQSPWQTATISRIEKRTPRVTSFWFQPSRPFTHLAGQHVDVRLTAPADICRLAAEPLPIERPSAMKTTSADTFSAASTLPTMRPGPTPRT